MNDLLQNPHAGAVADAAILRYRRATPRSLSRYEQACRVMPGGNTRSILHYDPYPVTMARGEGCTVWDLDGNRYTDFLGEYSAGLYGHSNPVITAAVQKALVSGIVLCAPNEYEVDLAELICSRFPSCDSVRFCNSGTEANLLAISTAKAFTGRDKIMVFSGAYHGSVFYFGEHHSRINAPFDYVVGEFNDADDSADLVGRHGDDLAAILVEPMQGGSGCIPGDPEFLQVLRQLSARCGAVLIFDEVMTSRLSAGGLQASLNIVPDMTTFGKYLGGGLTFGAFGGRREIMDQFDPRRPDPLVHPGTFNNNVLTMAAGLTGLRDIYTPAVATAHNQAGDTFRKALNEIVQRRGLPLYVSGIGSLLCIHFQRQSLRSISDKSETDARLRTLFHIEMLLAGIYLADRGYMALSLALGQEEYDAFIDRFAEFLDKVRQLLHE